MDKREALPTKSEPCHLTSPLQRDAAPLAVSYERAKPRFRGRAPERRRYAFVCWSYEWTHDGGQIPCITLSGNETYDDRHAPSLLSNV